MKIIPSFTPDKSRIHSRKDTKPRSASSTFAEALGEEVVRHYNESVESLLEDLDQRERQFLDHQSLADLNEYKKAVKKIMELVAQEGFETKTVTSRRLTNKKEYFLVKRIDEKLKELALAITSPSSASFNLLKQCEEIRGLIFDLVK